MNERMNKWIDAGWMKKCMNGRTHEWINERTNEWMDESMNEWTGKLNDSSMDELMNE